MNSVKCVIVGSSGVGKTCMITRGFENTYRTLYEPTVSNIHQFTRAVDGNAYALCISDTSGAYRFESLRSWDTLEFDVAIVCFSIVFTDSFHDVWKKWFPEVKRYSTAPIILVGTMLELRNDNHTLNLLKNPPILYHQGVEVARKIGAIMYLECSSVTGEGINAVFNNAVRAAVAPETIGTQKDKRCLLQ